jgi:branched-chain amino acid transport system permease protein
MLIAAGLSGWYQGHTLLLDLVMTSAIAAMSYQIALRSGVLAFISAGFWGVGAYAAGDIVVKTRLPWPVGILIGIAISAVGALLLSIFLRRLNGLYLGMATFAFVLVAGVLAAHGGHLTGGASGLQPIPSKISVPLMFLLFLFVCLLVSRLEVGRLGRAQELMHYDRELASAIGTRVTAWRHWIFVLSAAVGSAAGSLYALTFFSIDPTQIGFSTLIIGLATVVVGGLASWRGCLIGTIIVIGIPNLFQSLQIWEPVIYGGLLLLVAVFIPEGVFGMWLKALRFAGAARTRQARPDRMAAPEEMAGSAASADHPERINGVEQ